MARVPLSKSQLSREKENLVAYGRYLPALDLKRQQVMGERQRARRAIAEIEARIAAAIAEAGEAIPMLADRRVALDGLARLGAVRMGSQNVAGVRLPVVEHVEVIRASYGRMVRPHWVDAVVERLAAAIRLRVEARVAAERLELLEAAAVRITQRVNLFDKVLIPQARDNIRRINVYLGDAERAAVVRSKIAKKKREAEAQANSRAGEA
ncbi:V-type ATP synthase subunit D [Amaricoccus sp.]|uniref:V-type ATP synthase subunit D n=1 Tax=Amaricoccus sp. TaxID=1872485 RepID=UPI001B691CE0|nr:V-type ATP synthase subunit D [Amaricoccus sp.]MBP7002150.1 V-type ATP synthase subunit D [Amaricoccus sp.]